MTLLGSLFTTIVVAAAFATLVRALLVNRITRRLACIRTRHLVGDGDRCLRCRRPVGQMRPGERVGYVGEMIPREDWWER